MCLISFTYSVINPPFRLSHIMVARSVIINLTSLRFLDNNRLFHFVPSLLFFVINSQSISPHCTYKTFIVLILECKLSLTVNVLVKFIIRCQDSLLWPYPCLALSLVSLHHWVCLWWKETPSLLSSGNWCDSFSWDWVNGVGLFVSRG